MIKTSPHLTSCVWCCQSWHTIVKQKQLVSWNPVALYSRRVTNCFCLQFTAARVLHTCTFKLQAFSDLVQRNVAVFSYGFQFECYFIKVFLVSSRHSFFLNVLSVPVFTLAHVLVTNVQFPADLTLYSISHIFVNSPIDVACWLLVSKMISYEFLRGFSFLKCCIFLYGSGGDYEEEKFNTWRRNKPEIMATENH
jgi:hypothetical protein